MSELVVDSEEEYLNKAIDLATDQKKHRDIKDRIKKAKKSGKYFDTKKYTLNLEKAYKKIHEMRISQNKFKNIYINDN